MLCCILGAIFFIKYTSFLKKNNFEKWENRINNPNNFNRESKIINVIIGGVFLNILILFSQYMCMEELSNFQKKILTIIGVITGGGLFCLFTYWFIIEDLVKKIKSRK